MVLWGYWSQTFTAALPPLRPRQPASFGLDCQGATAMAKAGEATTKAGESNTRGDDEGRRSNAKLVRSKLVSGRWKSKRKGEEQTYLEWRPVSEMLFMMTHDCFAAIWSSKYSSLRLTMMRGGIQNILHSGSRQR
ncbi:conserved hypothetical protein [Ricinus communis]|uniref:Uncharacterized protein n=1 Tax=Ricinus communis TaxID=3988 RepID=B9SX18_RICCO|nr:conserved hypothetical protein [Ricinus communis]